MKPDQLVTMANRIAAFFAAMPDHAEAVDGVATHVRKFWDPRMRGAMLDAIAAGRADALHPLAREAFDLLAARA
jgi:formate dehydrogenase subunit delta